jgi:uncharacterized secreted protein with C-terminal beta-propeller domain
MHRVPFLLLYGRARAQLSVQGSVSSSSQLNGPWGLTASGSYVYAALYDGHGLAIVDVSSSASPSVHGLVTNTTSLLRARYVALNSDVSYAYVTADHHVTIVDIQDKSNPLFSGAVYHVYLDEARQVVVSPVNSNYVFVACAGTGRSLFSIDVSAPGAPALVGYLRDTSRLKGAHGLAVNADRAYVACSDGASSSLVVIHVGDPSAPYVEGYVPEDASRLQGAWAVVLSSTYAYVAARGVDTLTVVDISASHSPSVSANLTSPTQLDGIASLFLAGDQL